MLYFYVTVIYKLYIKVVFNTKKEVCFFIVHPCTSDHTTEGMPLENVHAYIKPYRINYMKRR